MGTTWHGSKAMDGTPLGEVMTMQEMIDNVRCGAVPRHAWADPNG